MIGAIIGDIVGSKYEFNNLKSKEFPLYSPGCSYTDDSVMTVAVARALMRMDGVSPEGNEERYREAFVREMQLLGRAYPYPQGGYGGRFFGWIFSQDPKPYNSWGNGSAMRVSPCGLVAKTMEEALLLAKLSSEVTHDHPEGIKGAQAAAAAVFLAKTGASMEEIRAEIVERYYLLDRTLDEIRPGYVFHVDCMQSVPEALEAFFESASFEDAIRGAVSIGGDSDTIAAITGGVAWPYYWYRNPNDPDMLAIAAEAEQYMPADFMDTVREFDAYCAART